ncbi:hypothetical protein ABZ723_08765 [Streptomyces sp. NPDC006700]|uniref:hypothetical protein n=1 Tax=unclassified Streptomyces TaxID=2593676 RepID=UPI0034078E94
MTAATMRAARFSRAGRRLGVHAGAILGYLNHAVLGHDGYTRRHLTQLMRLLASGRLDLSRSVSDVLPLEEVVRGVERLRAKEGNPVRLVVRP